MVNNREEVLIFRNWKLSLIRMHHRRYPFLRTHEAGAILVIVALIVLTVIISIAALVIDNARATITATDLQKTVDAASLAGSKELDGTVQGWKNAKRAVIALLKINSVFGSTGALPAGFVLDAGTIDNVPGGEVSPYQGTEGSAGNLVVTVERGAHWQKMNLMDGEAEYEFISFEGSPLAPGAVPLAYGAPVYSIANAIKVSVKVKDLGVTFSKVFGRSTLGDIERSAIAVSDEQTELCVLPVGIPACALMLETDPSSSALYQITGYNPRQSCERELVITEADSQDPQQEDGFLRSSSYPRLPYYYPSEPFPSVAYDADDPRFAALSEDQQPFLNHKAVPLQGVFGIPDSSGGVATGSDIARVFDPNLNGGCIKARLGQNFKPVDIFAPDLSFLNNGAVETNLVDLINGPITAPNQHFSAVFGDPLDPSNPAKPNFPFLQSMRTTGLDPYIELRSSHPFAKSTNPAFCTPESGCTSGWSAFIDLLMWPMLKGQWTNPMCHSAGIVGADNAGSAADSARAKSVKVMVIASQNVDYCDFQNLFTYQKQTSAFPTSTTNPRVVGFLDAHLFDFNIKSLGATPKFIHGSREIIDRNPYLWGVRGIKANIPFILDHDSGLPGFTVNPNPRWTECFFNELEDAVHHVGPFVPPFNNSLFTDPNYSFATVDPERYYPSLDFIVLCWEG